MKLKLNSSQISQTISNDPKMKRFISQKVKILVDEYIAKNTEQMVNEFENHPVTKEIESGPEATNITNTLGGAGNLFSYIGFEEGSNPIEVIKDILKIQQK